MAVGVPAVRRGTLRLYLGVASGVGKTYAMLAEGQRRRRAALTWWPRWWKRTAGS